MMVWWYGEAGLPAWVASKIAKLCDAFSGGWCGEPLKLSSIEASVAVVRHQAEVWLSSENV